MNDDRIINPELENDGEEKLENTIRPQILEEYIGQDKVKETMKIYIEMLSFESILLQQAHDIPAEDNSTCQYKGWKEQQYLSTMPNAWKDQTVLSTKPIKGS